MIKNKILKYRDLYFGNDVLRNSFWAITGSFVLRISGLLAGILVAKILGADLFGKYGILKNFILSITILATFGFGYTATKFVAENISSPSLLRSIIRSCNRMTALLSGLISLVMIIFSKQIAEKLFNSVDLTLQVQIIAIWLFFSAFTTLQQAYIFGLSEYKSLSRINIYVGIFTFIVTVVFTRIWNLNGALYSLVTVQVVNCILNYHLLRQILGRQSEETSSVPYPVWSLISANIPITLHDLSYAFFAWLGSFVIVKYYSYQQLGLYSVGMQWFTIIIYIPSVLRNVVLSTLSSGTNDSKSVVTTMVKINLSVTAITSALVIIGYPFISMLYGKAYNNMQYTIAFLCLAAILTSVINVYIQSLISMSKYWIVLVLRLFYDVSIITLFIILHYSKFNKIFNGAEIMALTFFIITAIYFAILKLLYRKVNIT